MIDLIFIFIDLVLIFLGIVIGVLLCIINPEVPIKVQATIKKYVQ